MILRPYQEEGRDFLAARRHALLADEMRVGKTPQAILAAQKAGVKNPLVVCPAIAVAHWYREFGTWWPGFNGGVIVSYDKAKQMREALFASDYDLLIVDECHYAKNPEAERTKLIYGKDGLGWKIPRLWAISGTPAPKHAGELWCMLRAFGVTKLHYPDFVARYCIQDPQSRRIIGTKGGKVMQELRTLLSSVMLRRMRKDVAPDMPAIQFSYLPVEPQGVDLRGPEQVPDAELEAWLAANNAANRDDRIDVAMMKVPALCDAVTRALDDGEYTQTVVFGWHVEPLQKFVADMNMRGVATALINGQTPAGERERIQARFKEGRIKIVAANIAAAGTAIDLSAASHGYFLELDWVPGSNMQAANRLVSMQKKEPVTFDVLSVPDSVDERVQKTLLRRAQEIGKLMQT